MKKLMIVMVMVMCLGSLAFAGTTDTITLKVTPITSVSVDILTITEYDFGDVALQNGTTENGTAVQVKNDGDCQASWKHKTTDATGGTTWTLTTDSPSTDEYRLYAEIGESKPGSYSHTVATTDGAITGGSAVGAGVTKNLWFQLEMPWAVTGAEGNAQHSATYTVTAEAD